MSEILLWTQSVLQTTPNRWLELAGRLPEELLRLPPKPSEWSAIECLRHLLDTERSVFPFRVRALLAGQDFPGFNPDTQGSKTASLNPFELAGQFQALRQASLELLATLQESDLSRQAKHQDLGPVTLSELLNEWAGHDLMHTIQAERALMQPFIQQCGPWQKFFLDHWIK